MMSPMGQRLGGEAKILIWGESGGEVRDSLRIWGESGGEVRDGLHIWASESTQRQVCYPQLKAEKLSEKINITQK